MDEYYLDYLDIAGLYGLPAAAVWQGPYRDGWSLSSGTIILSMQGVCWSFIITHQQIQNCIITMH